MKYIHVSTDAHVGLLSYSTNIPKKYYFKPFFLNELLTVHVSFLGIHSSYCCGFGKDLEKICRVFCIIDSLQKHIVLTLLKNTQAVNPFLYSVGICRHIFAGNKMVEVSQIAESI